MQSGRKPISEINDTGAKHKTEKILFFVNDMAFFVSHRLEVAKGAIAAGYQVAVVCPHGAKQAILEQNSIRHIPVGLARGGGNIYHDLLAFKRLYSLLRKEKPSLIHLVTSKPIIIGGLICRYLKIPVVAAISGLGHIFIDDGFKSKLLRKAVIIGYRVALHRKNAWAVFQNDDNKDLFQKSGILYEPPTMIRGMGVDISRFDPSLPSKEALNILMPCRMLYTKGVSEFVEAARILKRKSISAHFILMGDPDPANPAAVPISTLRGWHREGIVTWNSHSDAIESAMHDSDIIVLPSYNEGFPKTLIDAAAAGRPAVTSDVTGCRDAIINGETGLLAEPKNPQDLAEKIERVIKSPSLRRRMSREARKHAEKNFAIESIVCQHLLLYSLVISQSSKRC